MKTYDKFPKYYDEIIRGEGYDLDEEVAFIDEIIKGKKEVLEFACGTGIISYNLQKLGYKVFGVDLSEQMIFQAQKKFPKLKENFFVGNMISINLEKKFDIVLCNYNSVCHLNSWENWEIFFKNSFNHLKKDGIFIFDILTIFEFENIRKDFRGFFNIGDDTICLEMFKKGKFYTWFIKIFEKQKLDNYKLYEEEIKEISFSIEKIGKYLQKIGFKDIKLVDYFEQVITNESERVYFICKKK